MGQVMEQVTIYRDGSRLVHRYEEMTREKRPQDARLNGRGLQFEPQEHHGFDCCPEVIVLRDAETRSCVYVCEQRFSNSAERPEDPEMDGSGLRFETLAHGGEIFDRMPQALRVTDEQGRSCLYTPIKVDGRVVDSKGFSLEQAKRSKPVTS